MCVSEEIMVMFMCAHVYDVTLCGNTVSCSSYASFYNSGK